MRIIIYILSAVLVSACVPNTYYSTTDEYVVGLRWNDRGDYESAAKYWDPLVEKGDCDAEHMIGRLYFTGNAKPQSDDKALELWLKSAKANQQMSQWAMGDLYYQNKKDTYFKCAKCKIERDLVEALFWYKLFDKSAKYAGERKYLNNILPKITAEMTAEQMKEAEIKVAAWTPTPRDCGARNLL